MMILITGGSSGIGLAVAKRSAARGAPICINYHSDENAARKAREELAGADAVFVRADILCRNDVVCGEHAGLVGYLTSG